MPTLGRRRAVAVALLSAGLLALALGPTGAAIAHTSGAIPACPPGTTTASQPACLIGSWANPARYGSPLHASLKGPITRRWIKASATTGYGHWLYTVRVDVRNPLEICPAPTPLGSIPCQAGATSVGVDWYQAGEHTIQPPPAGLSGDTSSCNASGTACSVSFFVYPEELYGTLQMICFVTANQLTRNPVNDLGQAGAEFPISLSVAKVAR